MNLHGPRLSFNGVLWCGVVVVAVVVVAVVAYPTLPDRVVGVDKQFCGNRTRAQSEGSHL